jgi:hypothetical protein
MFKFHLSFALALFISCSRGKAGHNRFLQLSDFQSIKTLLLILKHKTPMKTRHFLKITSICLLLSTSLPSCKKAGTEPIANEDIQSDGSYIPDVFKDKYINGTGSFSEYSLIKPPEATYKQYSNLIKIENDQLDYYSYAVDAFPLEPSSGNLETDAQNLLGKFVPGYELFIRSGGSSSNISYETGKTMQGFDYLKIILEVKITNALRAKSIVVIKVGDKVATLLSDQAIDAAIGGQGTMALNYILLTIRFNGVPAPGIVVKKNLLGTWGTAGTTTAFSFSYYGTNTFSFGGITEIRTSKDADFDNVYTTTVGGSGAYTLKGNELTEKWKATGNSSRYIVNLIRTKSYLDNTWKTQLWKININPDALTCEGLPCLRAFERPYDLW